MEEKEMKYSDRVKEAITETNKEIVISIPRPLFKRFKRWAYANANDCWWLAIDKLLTEAETKQDFNTQVRMLMDRDDMIIREVEFIKQAMVALSEVEETPKKRTFGKGE